MLLCEIQALSHLKVFPIVLEYLEKSEFVLLSFSLGAKRQQKYFVEIELEGPQDLNRELFADGPFALADFNPSKLSISDGGGHLQDDDNLVSARIRKRARFASVDLRLVKGTGTGRRITEDDLENYIRFGSFQP